MLDLFNLPTPQGCNIQTFYGGGTVSNTTNTKSWTKPRGVSNIYMLLIGAGGTGDGTNGGGSGAVTVWYGAAQNVPDQLEIHVGQSGNATQIKYRTISNTTNVLAIANTGSTPAGGTASNANVFAASGFFQSIAGQAGFTGAITASSTTFLSGGGGGGTTTGNYGYAISGTNPNGFFQLQPIIVGVGGNNAGGGGLGCGGGFIGTPGFGGSGFVLIASW